MMDLLKLYSLYKAFAPVLVALAGGVLAVQNSMGVNHPTILGSIAAGLLTLLGADAVRNAHGPSTGVDKSDPAQNPPT